MRRRLLAQVHIAKAALGLDDATYRAILWEQAGVESSAKASVEQLQKLVRHFEGKGWKKKRRPASPQAGKIRALWHRLCEAGAVRVPQPGWPIALRAFVKRMTNVDSPEWLDASQAGVVIEALKQWLKREGVSP